MILNKWTLAQFLEKKWWHYYLSSKIPEEYLKNKKKYWNFYLDQIQLHPKPTDHIIDLGCGPAGIGIIFNNNVNIGVDPLVDFYKVKFKDIITSQHGIQFVKSELEHYIPSNTFKYVFCLNAINHVRDIDACMKNILLCGNHDSTFVISSDMHRSKWTKAILKWLPMDMLHPKQMDRLDFENLFKAYGLEVLRFKRLKSKFIFDYNVYVLKKK